MTDGPRVDISGTVYVYEADGTEHIISFHKINSDFEIREDGYVVPKDDHKCPECYDYNEGEVRDY